ncbi:Na/Pi cotransporter family protein [Sulfurovum mangrovi]|uniref:Na/Pi cotransporter family protein n=1 Tax=Sulfurovum mangrovi TaxID=2893889 RepID=UPI001E35422B|nr:Na/Pi symporter [Sulfurovum mangrovi]UFH60066.1 Na/Pi symporter [Sulfurovum mangrovi]
MGLETIFSLSQLLGGIGIFMIGMIIMTEGLRALAGDRIRKALMHFTKTPSSGALTGAITTAILQSSSATTVAAVGFVGAGLLAFPEALGIIFGANIGTTITGWMVALLGFKLKLGTVILPFILLGAMLKLFFSDKFAAIGYALAGFGLIFVGIEWMQGAMSGVESVLLEKYLPEESWLGRFQLLIVGIIVTVITQSSSAGVAAALTLLYTGLIGFEQAAALVIGMDVGTTFTAAMATIGGSVEVKRTGISHVIYNFFTGVMALLLITPYTAVLSLAVPNVLSEHAELALVGFHTFFNTLGVIMVLPFAERFAGMMEHLIPKPKRSLHYRFEDALLEDIPVALSLVQKYLEDEWKNVLLYMHYRLANHVEAEKFDLEKIERRLEEIEIFCDKIHLSQSEETNWKRLIDIIHITDHLQRLIDRCQEDQKSIDFLMRSEYLKEGFGWLYEDIEFQLKSLDISNYNESTIFGKKSEKKIKKFVFESRESLTALMADDTVSIIEGGNALEALKWLSRTSSHIARISKHMEAAFSRAGEINTAPIAT